MNKNSILDQLVYDEASGTLTYKGVRYMLIRPETIVGVQQAMEKISSKETQQAFMKGGFAGGYLSAKKYKEIYEFSDIQIIEFMMKMGTEIGWGKFQLNQYNPDKEVLRVTVEKSPFPGPCGPSSEGVCHLIRGVISGLASVLFSKHCEAAEINCVAKGANQCVFVVSPD